MMKNKWIIIIVAILVLAPNTSNARDSAYDNFQMGYYITALKQARQLADKGDAAAQALIGEIYWYGYGITQNRKKAVEWYKLAAENRYLPAQVRYAELLINGDEVEKNVELAKAILTETAEMGDAKSQFLLAEIIVAERPTWAGYKRALPWFEKAAETGYAKAQYALAIMHAEAKGVEFGDQPKARELLKLAANAGMHEAQLEYARFLLEGRGGTQRIAIARKWLRKAALQGNEDAQIQLARHYLQDSQPDLVYALVWYIIAEKNGGNDKELKNKLININNANRKLAEEIAEDIINLNNL